MKPLFQLGRLVATPGAIELAEKGVDLLGYIARHSIGDWGDLDASDKRENQFSLSYGFRLVSMYHTKAGPLYIITEADRSSTCLLTPQEY